MSRAPNLPDRSAASGQETVSVIIPTRNRPALLQLAVASVLRQTRPVDQIIVIDDGSDSTEWSRAGALCSPLVEVVRRSRCGGVAAARNQGLARARGDYLIFLDDDDEIDPRFVERGLAVLTESPEVDGVFFRFRTLAADPPEGTFWLAVAANPVPRATLEERPFAAFMRYLVPICSCLLRRSAVASVRFPEDLVQGEDTYFWLSLAASGRRFVLDEHAYALVRRHDGNLTRSRVRYMREIQSCYEKLLASGVLPSRDHVFLAHLKLLCFKLASGGDPRPHLAGLLGSPHRLASEAAFWTMNLTTRVLRGLREVRSGRARRLRADVAGNSPC